MHTKRIYGLVESVQVSFSTWAAMIGTQVVTIGTQSLILGLNESYFANCSSRVVMIVIKWGFIGLFESY